MKGDLALIQAKGIAFAVQTFVMMEANVGRDLRRMSVISDQSAPLNGMRLDEIEFFRR